MDDYQKVVKTKLKFKGSVLPTKEKSSKCVLVVRITA